MSSTPGTWTPAAAPPYKGERPDADLRPIPKKRRDDPRMKTASLPILAEPALRAAPELQLNPFLHVGDDRVYNPLADRTLLDGEPGSAGLRGLLAGALEIGGLPAAERAQLAAEGWLLPGDAEPARRFRLKYVSLEAHTVCNQSCYFCPVSIAPRADYFMPTELY